MIIFPAIDLYEGKAVRLLKGDYNQMTVYSGKPSEKAVEFARCGAEYIHLVDLEGAKDGTTPNFEAVSEIVSKSGLKAEIGGGIRSMETIEKYLKCGVDRVILGTAAVNDRELLKAAVDKFGDRIAVGADMADGIIAVNGWRTSGGIDGMDFCEQMQNTGVKYIICTDISKDGAMQGTNRQLYSDLSKRFDVNITASGGVSSLDDVRALNKLGIYGAIIGKALYTGAIDLHEAIEVTKK